VLEQSGWNSFFSSFFEQHAPDGHSPARVTFQGRDIYRIITAGGEFLAEPSGRMRHFADESEWPVCGDWVTVTVHGDGALIHEILPRRTCISRKDPGKRTSEQVLAANIDTVFLVSGLDADFNLRRIERYLVIVREGGAEPVILLNKADLCPDPAGAIDEVRRISPGSPVFCVSALDSASLAGLDAFLLRGRTVALLGSSGVGKSTLLNLWLDEPVQKTREVIPGSDRGRHTTTARQLFFTSWGGMVIDTPGLREIQVWGTDAGASAAFPDIEALAGSCRYRDCTHEREPGCAVRAAARSGALEPNRLENYLKLRREIGFLALRQEHTASYVEKQRWKKVSTLAREFRLRAKARQRLE
jgi:ribosome biogenesis GTPase / thiamine phosphate phosphatase